MIAAHLPGDFQLAHIEGQAGTFIRIAQALNGDGFADYEHARLYLGNGLFVEAQPGGAVVAEHRPLDGPGLLWSSGIIDLTPSERIKIQTAAVRFEGTPYSFLDYAALATKRLNIPAPGLRAYVKSTGHMICSQLVARAYFEGGHQLFKGWTGDVTPGDLYQLLEQIRNAH